MVLGASSTIYPSYGVSTTPVVAKPIAETETAMVMEVVAEKDSSEPVFRRYKAPLLTGPVNELTAWITAYSSTPEQTDDTPFITASGSTVRDGIVATNLLPFGTKVKFPELFGDKVFIVEDRMHQRKMNNFDIWMSSTEAARKFGITFARIIVLESDELASN